MKATRDLIILAIDQAATSGWAMARVTDGKVSELRSGTAKTSDERKAVVSQLVWADYIVSAQAMPVPSQHALKHVQVVFEDHGGFHFGRGNMSMASVLGMGAARGRWLEQLEGVGLKKSRIQSVSPKAWRKAVLGLAGNASSERAKQAALLYARAKYGLSCTDDEAEALCMLAWAVANVAVVEERKESA